MKLMYPAINGRSVTVQSHPFVSICCVNKKNVSLTQLEAGGNELFIRIWVHGQCSEGLSFALRLQSSV